MSHSLFLINIATPFVKQNVVSSKTWFDVRVPFTKFQSISLDTFGFVPSNLLNIHLEYTGRDYDHAGFHIGFGCMLFEVCFQWYDSRHAIEDKDE